MGSLKAPAAKNRPARGRTLPASTLIETIIASVIFMCVFAISLHTVSQLTLRNDGNIVLVEADYRIMECFRQYGDGTYDPGQYKKEYDWGTVTILIRPYGEYANLREMTITANVRQSLKQLKFRHVIEHRDE